VSLTDDWYAHLELLGRSPNTIRTYQRTLKNLPNIADATRVDVEAWWETRAHLSPATRNNELAAVRQFYKWAIIFEHRNDDPTLRITGPNTPRGLPHPLTKTELTHLLKVLPPDLCRALALGAYAGLRVAEAAALAWVDIDRETNRIRVTGKGNKTRLVGLHPLLLDQLLPDTGLNVVTGTARTYTAGGLGSRINKAMRANGVDASFHAARHRFGTFALAGSGNLLAVSRAMGHAKPETTAIYAAAMDSDLDVIAASVFR
jgi:site-specific recombinase XerD